MLEKNNSGNKQPKDTLKDSSDYVTNMSEPYMSKSVDKTKEESTSVPENERDYANALLAALGSFNKKILTPKFPPQANALAEKEAASKASSRDQSTSAKDSLSKKEDKNLENKKSATKSVEVKTDLEKSEFQATAIPKPEVTLDLRTLEASGLSASEDNAKSKENSENKTVTELTSATASTPNFGTKNKNLKTDYNSAFYSEKIEKHGVKSSKANKAQGEEKTESGRIQVSKLTQKELSHSQEKDFDEIIIPEFSFDNGESEEENVVKSDGYTYPKIHFDNFSNVPTSNHFNADGTTYDEITLLSPESEVTLDPDLDKSFPKDDRFSGDNLNPKEGPLSAYFEADNSSSFKKILDNYNPHDKSVKLSSSTAKISPQKASLIASNRQAAKKFADPEAAKAASKNANLKQQGRKIEEADSNESYQSIQEPAKSFTTNPESFYDTSGNKGLEQDISLGEIAQVASQHREVYLETNDEEANFELLRLERKRRKAHIRSYRRSPTLFVLRQIIKPLSLINPFLSVILGAAISLPAIPGDLDKNILIASLLTVFFVQIFANLCREYSTEELISRFECSLVDHKFATRKTIYRYTIIAFILSCISGATLIYFAKLNVGTTLVFAGLGIITITMLLRYSVGENPYSFSIFGEFSYLFVYGLLMVGASFFLQVHRYENIIIVPALACGFCAVASLNLINMRDSYVSALYEKENFATFLGPKAGRLLQTLLYFGAVVLYTYFNYVLQFPAYCYAFLISVPLIIYHLIVVHQDVKSSTLNLQKYVTTAINITMTGGFALTLWLFLSR